ncbi:purpurin-like [Sarcophilus harrisii]
MRSMWHICLLLVLPSFGRAQTCAVDSIPVKTDFDPKRYAGKWYALSKKDPEGLFLQDNISAEYTIGMDGTMTASSQGRVKLFGFWVICADMAAQYTVPDPTTPAKMYMTYQGLASYLSSGVHLDSSFSPFHLPAFSLQQTPQDLGLFLSGLVHSGKGWSPPWLSCRSPPPSDRPSSLGSGDDYWVIDTDYTHYAVTYACRLRKEDGTCADGYSIVFSRSPRGFPPAIQRIVRQKQEEICLSGQFEPVLQTGVWLCRG